MLNSLRTRGWFIVDCQSVKFTVLSVSIKCYFSAIKVIAGYLNEHVLLSDFVARF